MGFLEWLSETRDGVASVFRGGGRWWWRLVGLILFACGNEGLRQGRVVRGRLMEVHKGRRKWLMMNVQCSQNYNAT
jgi:hypothetical protein